MKRLFIRKHQAIKKDNTNNSKSSISNGILIGVITGIITSLTSSAINFFYWKKQFDVSENSKSIQLQSALLDSISEQSFDVVGLLENRTLYRLKVLKLDNPKLDSIPSYSIAEADSFEREVTSVYPGISKAENIAKDRIKKLFMTSFRLLYLMRDSTIKNQIFKTLSTLEGHTIDSTIAAYVIKEFNITKKNVNAIKIDWDKIDPAKVSKKLSQIQLAESMNLISLFTSRIYNVKIVLEKDTEK